MLLNQVRADIILHDVSVDTVNEIDLVDSLYLVLINQMRADFASQDVIVDTLNENVSDDPPNSVLIN